MVAQVIAGRIRFATYRIDVSGQHVPALLRKRESRRASNGRLGVFTDGYLRRALDAQRICGTRTWKRS